MSISTVLLSALLLCSLTSSVICVCVDASKGEVTSKSEETKFSILEGQSTARISVDEKVVGIYVQLCDTAPGRIVIFDDLSGVVLYRAPPHTPKAPVLVRYYF